MYRERSVFWPTRTDRLFAFLANLHGCFNSTILWTDHQQHALVLRCSLKSHRIISFVWVFLGLGLTAFTIVCAFEDKSGHRLRAVRPWLARDVPETLLWIENLAPRLQSGTRTESHPFRYLHIFASIHKLGEARHGKPKNNCQNEWVPKHVIPLWRNPGKPLEPDQLNSMEPLTSCVCDIRPSYFLPPHIIQSCTTSCVMVTSLDPAFPQPFSPRSVTSTIKSASTQTVIWLVQWSGRRHSRQSCPTDSLLYFSRVTSYRSQRSRYTSRKHVPGGRRHSTNVHPYEFLSASASDHL